MKRERTVLVFQCF